MNSARLAMAMLLAGGTLMLATATAAAAPTIVLMLDERSIDFQYEDRGEPGQSVGDVLRFQTAITDVGTGVSRGTKDATCTTIHQDDRGHYIASCVERIELDDGVIRATGSVDQTALPSGQVQTLRAYGTSGSYRGLVGTERYRATEYPVRFRTEIRIALGGQER